MRLAALIVTYNRLEALKGSLPRMLAEDVDHVLVVDNASTDGTGAWLAGLEAPGLEVLTLAENTGGAGGFAAGLAHLGTGAGSPDWTCLLDDDAWPEAGAMALFRSEMARLESMSGANPPPGVVGAAVFLPDGTPSEMNRPGQNPFWHLPVLARALFRGGRAGFHVRDDQLTPEAPPYPADTISFVGYFLSRGAIRAGGLPEAGLFIYGDDLLYSLRLRRRGVRLELWPALRFVHDCGSIGAGMHYRPLWKIYYHSRNGVAIAREAAGWLIFPLALAYYTIVWWRRSRHVPAPQRGTYRRLMWRGIRDGLMWRRGRVQAVHDIAALAEAGPSR